MRLFVLLGILMAMVAAPASARTVWVTGNVDRTIITGDDEFGGCLAALSSNFQANIPACRTPFLSLDCAGTFGGKAAGSRRLDQMILAAAMGIEARVRINTDKVIDGWCVADGVQVIFPAPAAE